jgi:hypothetical protein
VVDDDHRGRLQVTLRFGRRLAALVGAGLAERDEQLAVPVDDALRDGQVGEERLDLAAGQVHPRHLTGVGLGDDQVVVLVVVELPWATEALGHGRDDVVLVGQRRRRRHAQRDDARRDRGRLPAPHRISPRRLIGFSSQRRSDGTGQPRRFRHTRGALKGLMRRDRPGGRRTTRAVAPREVERPEGHRSWAVGHPAELVEPPRSGT